MAALIVNPKRRKSKRTARRVTARKSVRKSIRRKSNPARRSGLIGNQIMPALIGGVGAVGANFAFKYVANYLPASVQTGNMQYLAQGAFIVAAGMLLDKTKLGDKRTRDSFVQGALAVTAFRLVDSMATSSGILPANVSGYQRLGGYQNLNGMGYQSSSPVYAD